jgi:hypothetical protein
VVTIAYNWSIYFGRYLPFLEDRCKRKRRKMLSCYANCVSSFACRLWIGISVYSTKAFNVKGLLDESAKSEEVVPGNLIVFSG